MPWGGVWVVALLSFMGRCRSPGPDWNAGLPVPHPKDEPVQAAPTAGLRKSRGRPPLSTLPPKKMQPPQRSHHRTRSAKLSTRKTVP
jgi:hypothetical protein